MNRHVRPPTRPLAHPLARALAARLDPLTARVRGDELTWLAGLGVDPAGAFAESLVAAGRACLAERRALQDRADALRALCAGLDPRGRREALARHLRGTIHEASRLRADLAALARDLDLDALLEREAGEQEARGARLEVVVRLLSGAVSDGDADAFERTGAHALLCDVAAWDPRPATRRAAVSALAHGLAAHLARASALDPRGLRVLRTLVLETGEDPWARRRALDVVHGLPSDLTRDWLEETLALQGGPDEAPVRARAMELLLEVHEPWSLALAAARSADPAESVRAVFVDGLVARAASQDEAALALLDQHLHIEPEPRLRARVARGLGELGEAGLARCAALLGDVPLVASYAIGVALAAARDRRALPDDLVEGLARVREAGPPALAREAALVLAVRDHAGGAAWPLAVDLSGLDAGARRRVKLPAGVDVLALASALSVFAADGFGFSLRPRGAGSVDVTRGEPQTGANWRVLHEVRNPGPVKRQGQPHTLGRRDEGPVRVPPGALAEEAATGVPGQRVRAEAQGGWVPGVPMVDDYVDACTHGEVVLATPEGVTRVRAPERWIDRRLAELRLTWDYRRFDALRAESLAEADPALRPRYVRALRALGYRTTFEGPPGPTSPFVRALLDPVTYLVSMGSNSLAHLAIVVLGLLATVYGRAALARAQVRAARARIPLVVGGWGTRGKSGTERLKAAVFEGLGLPVLSKTTGCEAMVLHAPPGGHAVELFLFRPFDKASIWEQVDVVRLADRLGARALLWECMALRPAYVDLLQAGWMRDDLSTLTNAYPDHEDIQGPTGMDVAAVLGGFAPPDALLVTTESNMLPVLRHEATARGTEVVPLDRAAHELLPRDLLDRLPYAEHPANVALAAAVAGALGVSRVEAIGLMADHVVPDLGALVVYPAARHLGREVVFANGMSANDTLSFRHNWRRTGFATHDHVADPGRWLVTVVNNRADRVARSRVFAQILAEDANAHRHVLIGTNLRGLVRYLDAAVRARAAGWVLDGDPARVDALFAHLRLVDPAALGRACGARLRAPEASIAAWEAAVAEVRAPTVADLGAARDRANGARGAAESLEAACAEGAGLAEALIEALARWLAWRAARQAPPLAVRALYADLVRASVIVVDDASASGDQVIAKAVGAVPPGAVAAIMGVQNIKGTGLDFAYQWVWWRQLHGALAGLRAHDPERRRAAMDAVEAVPLGTVHACEALLDVLADLRGDARLGPRVLELVARAEARRDALLLARRRGAPAASPARRVLDLLERALDPLDGVLRRRRADQVFADLAAQRISHARAQSELRRLTDRQKGGWLPAVLRP